MNTLNHQLRFWHGDEPGYPARRAQGVFDMWTQMGRDAQAGSVVEVDVDRTLLLVTVPSYMAIAQTVYRLARTPTSAVIVDVPRNVLDIHTLIDTRMRSFWADDGHRKAARYAIAAADAVVVSDVSIYPACAALNPHVHVMPDTDGREDDIAWRSRLLTRLWVSALRRKNH